jgi:hypothetical protein
MSAAMDPPITTNSDPPTILLDDGLYLQKKFPQSAQQIATQQ